MKLPSQDLVLVIFIACLTNNNGFMWSHSFNGKKKFGVTLEHLPD